MSAHQHHEQDHLTLYEGDQSKLYSGIMNHHTDVQSSASKNQVKRIWKITLWLSIITIVEVGIGLAAYAAGAHNSIIIAVFLILTILKAGLIVRVFMHLGDERKNFVAAVLIPMGLFIWMVLAFLSDGAFWLKMNNTQAGTKTELHK